MTGNHRRGARPGRVDARGPMPDGQAMRRLTEERCVACRADAPSVTPEEVRELKPQTSEWTVVEEDGVPKLDRIFRFEG